MFYAFLHRRHPLAFLNESSVLAEWAVLPLSSRSQWLKPTNLLEACAPGVGWRLCPHTGLGPKEQPLSGSFQQGPWVGFSLEFKMSFPQQFIGQNLSQDPVQTGNAILPSAQKVESQEELVET